MRIVLVLGEASVWKAAFVERVLARLPAGREVVGAVITGFSPSRRARLRHLRHNFEMLGPRAFLWAAARQIRQGLVDHLDGIVPLRRPDSVAGVCRRHGVPVLHARDVNAPATLAWVRGLRPEVVLNSGYQVFGRELLSIPTRACLNRHPALLPSYAGLCSIFWQLLHDERAAGVSVHTMTDEIDRGILLAQKAVPVEADDTYFSILEKCYRISDDVVLEAIEKVAAGRLEPGVSYRQPSYYSYPTPADIRRFRRMGKRIL